VAKKKGAGRTKGASVDGPRAEGGLNAQPHDDVLPGK